MADDPKLGDLVYFVTDAWGSKDKMFTEEARQLPLERLLLVLKVPASSKDEPKGLIVKIEYQKDVCWCHVLLLNTLELWWFSKDALGVSIEP